MKFRFRSEVFAMYPLPEVELNTLGELMSFIAERCDDAIILDVFHEELTITPMSIHYEDEIIEDKEASW